MPAPHGPNDRPTSLQERRASRRSQLLNSAMDVIRRDGPNATMEDMAAAAGITKPILYRHFQDRSGLVDAVAEVVIADLRAVVESKVTAVGEAGTRASVRATIEACFEYIDANPELFRFVAEEDVRLPGSAFAAFADDMAQRIGAALKAIYGEITFDDAAASVWGQATVGMVQRTASWWVSDRSVDRQFVVDQLAAVMWGGLTNPLRVAGPGRVFVYGTLMPGRLRWKHLEPYAASWHAAEVPGHLYDGGVGWPVAVFARTNPDSVVAAGSATVPGFLVDIDHASLARCLWLLDDIEETATDELRRVLVTTTAGELAWAYHFTRSTDGLTKIADWASTATDLER